MRLENIKNDSIHLPSSIQSRQITREITKSTNEVRENLPEISHSKEKVEAMVNNLNDFIEPLRTNLKFQFHEKLNEYYVEVVNPLTDEVIKEIPPKKMLDMYADMAELMGIIIDRKI